jgi:uncharacterized LabA/DUF88 family protein
MKTALLIDTDYLYHGARRTGLCVDYAKLVEYIRGLNPALSVMRAFLLESENGDQIAGGFIGKLERIGFKVALKRGRSYKERQRGNVQPALADAMINLVWDEGVSLLYVVAGHGDLTYAVETCQNHGAQVKLAYIDKESVAGVLLDAVDDHHPISQDCLWHGAAQS